MGPLALPAARRASSPRRSAGSAVPVAPGRSSSARTARSTPAACLHTAVKLGVQFSVTARQDKKVQAAIDAIGEDAWTPGPYWLSTPGTSGADVAETTYTAFSGTDALPVRLIVRRVRPTPGFQLALFTAWDYHALVTNRTGQMLELEADHRPARDRRTEHCRDSRARSSAPTLRKVQRQRRLARADRHGAQPRAGRRAARRPGPEHRDSRDTAPQGVLVPGRLVHTGRRGHLRLPESWPWAEAISTVITAVPLRC